MENRILVTGGAGFIGHHFILQLLKKTNWHITSLDRLDVSGNLNRLSEVLNQFPNSYRRRLKIVFHDLKAEINKIISKNLGNFDYIVHMAASSHVDRSISDPLSFVYDNVVGTCNILNFAKNQKKLKKFVYFSTDEVFGPAPKKVKYKEMDRYNSTNPYSASKAGGEELAVAYANTYKMPVVITHTMNVFGERQHPEKFIPLCIRKILNNQIIDVHSDSLKKKPGSRYYIHAEDVANGCLFILVNNFEKKFPSDFGGAKIIKFNLVGPSEKSNLDVVKNIARVLKKKPKFRLVDFHSSRPGHDLRYALDGSLLKKLGWYPRLTFEKRIEQVVNWTVSNKNWFKI